MKKHLKIKWFLFIYLFLLKTSYGTLSTNGVRQIVLDLACVKQQQKNKIT